MSGREILLGRPRAARAREKVTLLGESQSQEHKWGQEQVQDPTLGCLWPWQQNLLLSVTRAEPDSPTL